MNVFLSLDLDIKNIWVCNEDDDPVELVIHAVDEETDKYEVCEYVEDKNSTSMIDSWIKTKVYEGTFIQCHIYLEERWFEYCRTH